MSNFSFEQIYFIGVSSLGRHKVFRLMATGSVVLFMICIVLGAVLGMSIRNKLTNNIVNVIFEQVQSFIASRSSR